MSAKPASFLRTKARLLTLVGLAGGPGLIVTGYPPAQIVGGARVMVCLLVPFLRLGAAPGNRVTRVDRRNCSNGIVPGGSDEIATVDPRTAGTPLAALKLPSRIANALISNRITTVETLLP